MQQKLRSCNKISTNATRSIYYGNSHQAQLALAQPHSPNASSNQRAQTRAVEVKPASTMGTMDTAPNNPAFQKPTAMERAFNRFFGFLVGLGLGLKHNYLLQVRGRKSGKLHSTPIDLLELDGKRFLVAPRGRTQWVRNAEAAGEVTLKKGGFRQSFRVRAIPDAEK